ncbi:MAG: PQQ-binding-like beta-propeller repeat protein [Planctomycetota bacterium]|nr:PQQ-binding-like beta-propeller repeat protein [Planctomycetota bacterium]
MRMHLPGRILICLCAWAVCAPVGSAFGQDQTASDLLDTAHAKENATGVYPRDSAIALDRLALARRMEQLKEWGKSADLYQEILEKYPDRVVPAALDASPQFIQYTSVTESVRQSLCKWPAEGLDVYRGRYEATAGSILSSAEAGDRAKLHQIISMYFPTDAAKTAAIRLMDTYFEQGDYAAVVQIGRRLLAWHPNLVAERPMVLYRTAIAEKLSGDEPSAALRLDEIKKRFAQATGAVRGEDVVLADSLQGELASDTGIVRGAGGDSWLTFGGNESRDKLSSSSVKPGARLYSINLSEISWKWVSDPARRHDMEEQDRAQRKMGAGLGVMPAVDRGELFFQDNTSIYGIDLDSGLPLPGWATTHASEHGVYKLPTAVAALPAGQQLCVTINDKYVTAILGLGDDSPDGVSNGSFVVSSVYSVSDPQLVCLERQTGKELWRISMRGLPEAQSTLRGLQISGSPLIVGDNIYVVAHETKGQQFEDCHVLCFDVSNGQFRWESEIVSASNPITFNGDGQLVVSSPVSHIAYSGGRLFVVTGLGAAAALDAYDGAVQWLDIFRKGAPNLMQGNINMMRGGGMQQIGTSSDSTPPWVHNPAIVQDGKLFALPEASDSVFIYDTDSGRELKRINLSDLVQTGEQGKPDTLLAVDGDFMYLGGPAHVWQIPWQKYNHEDWSDGKLAAYWASVAGLVRGRSFVTADAIYMPTQDSLSRILRKTGQLEDTFPRNNWDLATEGPGNVLVTQDHLIVAGDRYLSVYTNLGLARIKLDQEVASAPADATPRLHYAEVMFASGQNNLADDKLNEAFALMGGAQRLQGGPIRDRAFNDVMTFAARLAEKNEEIPRINRLFDLAAAAAQSASQQVAYRIARAKFDRDHEQLVDAIELYQQILSDGAMRLVSQLDGQSGTASQAGIVAQQAIDSIISTSSAGRAAYAKFEAAAMEKFTSAYAANQPEQLLDVVHVYPNSQVARKSMEAAADVFEAKGNPRQAAEVLRKMLNTYKDHERAPLEEAMARDYLSMKKVDVAAARLTLAATESPDAKLHRPLVLPDGTTLKEMTLSEARNALNRYSVESSTNILPDLHLPVSQQREIYAKMNNSTLVNPFRKPSAETVIPNVAELVISPDGLGRNDRLIGWNPRVGLSVYRVGGGSAIFTNPDIQHFALGAAWVSGGLLAWSGKNVVLMDRDTGKNVWQKDISSLAPLDAVAVADPVPVARPPAAAGPQRVVIRVNGGVLIRQLNVPIDPTQVAPVVTPQPPNPSDDLANSPDEKIVQVRPMGDRIIIGTSNGRVLALENADGHVVWQTRVSNTAVDRLLVNDDFTVIRLQNPQSVDLIVLNSFSGELAGRKSFPMDMGAFPINLALAADGTLAYTTSDHLSLIDLFGVDIGDNGMEPKFTADAPAGNAQIFQNQTLPEQLLVHNGRVFAISDWGKSLRIFSLDTGKPWQFHSKEAQADVDAVLPTLSNNSANVTLHISGSYVYACGPQSLTGYQMDRPWIYWSSDLKTRPRGVFEQLLIGKDYLIALGHQRLALAISNKIPGHVDICGFNRAIVKHKGEPDREAGNYVYDTPVDDVAPNAAWQAFDGGIAYASGGSMHLLLGARDELPTTMPASGAAN